LHADCKIRQKGLDGRLECRSGRSLMPEPYGLLALLVTNLREEMIIKIIRYFYVNIFLEQFYIINYNNYIFNNNLLIKIFLAKIGFS
jgi:hypothetical protein